MDVKCCSRSQPWYTANEANLLITALDANSQIIEKAAGGIILG